MSQAVILCVALCYSSFSVAPNVCRFTLLPNGTKRWLTFYSNLVKQLRPAPNSFPWNVWTLEDGSKGSPCAPYPAAFCQSESSPTLISHDIKLLIKLWWKQLPDGPGIPIVRSKMNVIKKERESTYSYYSRSMRTRGVVGHTPASQFCELLLGRNRKQRAVLWFWR